MKKVNLEEILNNMFEPSSQDCSTPTQDLQLAIILNPDLNRIKEACRQVLELAAENVNVYDYAENIDYSHFVDKRSILNIINQIEQ